ncbi:hypothetical protein HN51_047877 [Arachis hypogaea]
MNFLKLCEKAKRCNSKFQYAYTMDAERKLELMPRMTITGRSESINAFVKRFINLAVKDINTEEYDLNSPNLKSTCKNL